MKEWNLVGHLWCQNGKWQFSEISYVKNDAVIVACWQPMGPKSHLGIKRLVLMLSYCCYLYFTLGPGSGVHTVVVKGSSWIHSGNSHQLGRDWNWRRDRDWKQCKVQDTAPCAGGWKAVGCTPTVSLYSVRSLHMGKGNWYSNVPNNPVAELRLKPRSPQCLFWEDWGMLQKWGSDSHLVWFSFFPWSYL